MNTREQINRKSNCGWACLLSFDEGSAHRGTKKVLTLTNISVEFVGVAYDTRCVAQERARSISKAAERPRQGQAELAYEGHTAFELGVLLAGNRDVFTTKQDLPECKMDLPPCALAELCLSSQLSVSGLLLCIQRGRDMGTTHAESKYYCTLVIIW